MFAFEVKRVKITEFIKKNIVILDGGMGTLLQGRGLSSGERPEGWNLTHPEVICDIHKAYFDAGSNVVCTNTFGANILKFSPAELEKIVFTAIENAKKAKKESSGNQKKWIALDIGPTGRMLKPLGDLDFEDAVSVFAETVKLGVKAGVDLIFIETMSDSYETKAALLAAKENSTLPVFVSCAYGEDGKLMTGADPRAVVAMLEGMGADAIGVNCSFGPDTLSGVVREYLEYASIPVILKPNAGLPKVDSGETVYDLSPDAFAEAIAPLVAEGVRAVGGCCGTTPEYIRALSAAVKAIAPIPLCPKSHTLVSSYTHAVEIGKRPILIGERINPTGKPRFREAVRSGNMEYILREAIGQEEAGAHILDVNLGIAGIDETSVLTEAVCRIQEISDTPLQIDSSDASAMESALRRYNGKAMINSVNGKAESMAAVFPLAKKYGGVLVALTLDEDGIPTTAEGRVNIAKKILAEAKKYGIDRKNIVFDPLAMAVSADKNAATETLGALKIITDRLQANTILGVSNISFGLPERDKLNAAFFTLAMAAGLSAAIINPYSEQIMAAYRSYLALGGLDEGFELYLSATTEEKTAVHQDISDLNTAIVKGMKELAASITRELVKKASGLDIINSEIIPALNTVGEGFEKKKIYLPGLLMSAEAASASFEIIKSAYPTGENSAAEKIVLATVKGDIHDIGKNILKLIFESYGYQVIDLGKDVPAEKIAETVLSHRADYVGLSALMTTTLPAMEQTVRLLRLEAPECKIMVGGAVLTEEYAHKIGADFYGKDAMAAINFVKK